MRGQRIIPCALTLALAASAGCVSPPPASIGATLAAQNAAAERLGVAYAEEHALLRAQVEALVAVRRVVLLGGLHRELLARGYLSPALEPVPDALDRDLPDAGVNTTLAREVRAGAMTRDQASAWLGDYALALKMSGGEGIREAMLGRLGPARALEMAAESLRAALDARREEMRALFADLDASGLALERFSSFRPAPAGGGTAAARESLGRLVIDRLSDPEKRAAAQVALDLLFPAPAPSGVTVR